MTVADDFEGLHHWNSGGHHGRKLSGKHRDVLRLRLSATANAALGFYAGRGDALASQIRTQRLFVRGERLAANLMAALVLALPDKLDFFLACRCGYRHKSVPRSHYLFDRDAVYLFQTGQTNLYFLQSRTT